MSNSGSASRAQANVSGQDTNAKRLPDSARGLGHQDMAPRHRDAREAESLFETFDHTAQGDRGFLRGRQHRVWIGLQFRERTDSDDMTLVEKNQLVRKAFDLGHIMCDIEDRQGEVISQLFNSNYVIATSQA